MTIIDISCDKLSLILYNIMCLGLLPWAQHAAATAETQVHFPAVPIAALVTPNAWRGFTLLFPG